MPRRTLLLAAAVTVAAAVLYGTRLGQVPAYLMHDELQFALQAQSIASSGRDLSGRVLPVFFTEPEFPAGRDPAIIYATAALLTVVPLSDWSARLPTALISAVSVVLVFLIARRLFASDWLALVSAGLLAFTPAHFIRGRLVLSPQYAIPIVLAWLLALVLFSERATVRRLGAAAAWIGLSAYTYLASVVMMPVYLAWTLWWGGRRLGRRAAVVAAVAFVVPLVPMAAWYVTHPERTSQIVSAYRLADAAGGGFGGATVVAAIRDKVGLLWSFFSPAFLFVSGDSSLTNSTRQVGFFPLAFVVLLPVGVYQLARARQPITWIILAGLATAPLAALLTGALEMNRLLLAIPFGVLTASYGMAALVTSRARAWRAIGVLLAVSVPIQFAGFYSDYMGRYRVDSAHWFGGNTRDLFNAAIARAGVDSGVQVLVSDAIPFAERYWRFYALASDRPDLIDRMERYAPGQAGAARAGTLLACPLSTAGCQDLIANPAAWRQVTMVAELAGSPSFALLERTANEIREPGQPQ
ncbi:MAG: ArnT family glycosyltransferase [Vicinamibacterales bacterium]